jgi:hypothetical protein
LKELVRDGRTATLAVTKITRGMSRKGISRDDEKE